MAHRKDSKCLEPFDYINKIPGKDVRGKMIDAFQSWLLTPHDKLEVIKDIVRSLHNASLLIDDIEDNSKLRRGIPVAHSIYGIPNTINCANYVYFLALEQCQQLKNSAAMNVFIQELLNLHRGQGQDILWRDNCDCPTEDQYKQMVKDKTGGLFRLAVGLMLPFSDFNIRYPEIDLSILLDLMSLYFQIRDDFLNLSSVAYMQTKSFCEDITEGKFSFPIIHAIRNFPNDSRLLNILRQRTEDVSLKKYAVNIMIECGSISYTRTVLKQLYSEIFDELKRISDIFSKKIDDNLTGIGRCNTDTLSALMATLESQLDMSADILTIDCLEEHLKQDVTITQVEGKVDYL